MKVRALFKCVSVDEETGDVNFDCNYDSAHEDLMRVYQKYTPSGHLRMNINVPETLALFKPDTQYFVDFTPAE